ncbi:MAG: energy transducer TonB [Bacteroidia bacterium]
MGNDFLFAQAENKKRKNGLVTNYYVGTKDKASQGNYRKHLKEGEWLYWYANGKIQRIVNYVNDTPQGKFVEYSESGILLREGNYMNGEFDGEFSEYNSKGALQRKCFYKNGELDGLALEYEDDVLVKQTITENRRVVYEKTFYPTGRNRRVSHYANGEKTGTWLRYESYNSNDTFPTRTEQYQDGVYHGFVREYRQGVLVLEIKYSNGKLNGMMRQWNDSGVIENETCYKNEILDSVSREYERGVLKKELFYENGMPVKTHRFIDVQANQVMQISYFNDADSIRVFSRKNREPIYQEGDGKIYNLRDFLPDSTTTFYSNGKIKSRLFLIEKKKITSEIPIRIYIFIEYDERGKIVTRGSYAGRWKTGEWMTFYPNGNKQTKLHYNRFGKAEGDFEAWYINGSKRMVCKVKNDKVADQPRVWNENGVAVKFGTPLFDKFVLNTISNQLDYSPDQLNQNYKEENREEIPLDAIVSEGQEPPVIKFAEKMPEYPGGVLTYIYENLRLPQDSSSEAKYGTVYVSFVVEIDGSVSHVKIEKGIPNAPTLNAEVLRIISTMPPNWKPGEMEGKPVRLQMTLPIRIEPK